MSDIPVWGIDLTAVCLRAIKLSLSDDGKIHAEAWDVIDFVEDVDNVHGVGRFDAFGRAIHRFVRNNDLTECRVIASIRGEAAFMRTITVPQVNDSNLDKLLEYEAQQHIPYPVADVFWDRRVVAIREGGDVVATIYAIKKAFVDERLHRLTFAGMPVDGLQLQPVALQNFCAKERMLEPGSVIVDVDYVGTQVLIVDGDQTWFRCLPVGAFELSNRIRERLKLDHLATAKLISGRSKPRAAHVQPLADLRAEIAKEIVSEVAVTIRGYKEIHPDFQLSGAVLFESHAAVPHVGEALKAELKVPVFRPKGFHGIEIDPGIVSAGIQDHFAGLARAAGLALQGLGKADVAIRLYPETIPRSFKPKKLGFLAAACLLAAIVGLGYKDRKALRLELEDGSRRAKALHDALVTPSRAELGKKLLPDPLGPVTARWKARTANRDGHLPFFDDLLTALAKPNGAERDESSAPYFVSFEFGDVEGRIPSPHAGRLVLARQENKPIAEIDRELGEFVRRFVGKGGLKSANQTEAWSCGSMTAKPPRPPDERQLRYRFRHVSWDLEWEAQP